MRKLRINDFFCGCGGMGIAFQNAGFEIAGAWDFDKYAVQSYRENVGDHVRQQDIKEMKYEDVPKADVWAFGFPCQDLSVAGKQRGMVLKCEDCGEDLEINPEEYQNKAVCPHCGGDNFKASSRSGCFFEMMRPEYQHEPYSSATGTRWNTQRKRGTNHDKFRIDRIYCPYGYHHRRWRYSLPGTGRDGYYLRPGSQ